MCLLFIALCYKSNSFSVAQWSKKLVGGESNKHMKAPESSSHGYAKVPLKNFASSSSKVSAHTLILSHNTHSFPLILFGHTHPLKNPQNHSLQHSTQVPSHSLAFTRWNIPEKREKTPGRHEFLFFHSTFPLRSISLVRVKTNSSRLQTGKLLHCITQACFAPWCSSKPKNKPWKAGWRHRYTPPCTPHPAPPNIDLLCVNVWGLFSSKVGCVRVCLGWGEFVWGCIEHVRCLSELCEWSVCVEGLSCLCLWAWLELTLGL